MIKLKNGLKNKTKTGALIALVATLFCCAVAGFTGIFGAKVNEKPVTADAAVSISGTTYTATGSCADMAAAWAQAIEASTKQTITFKLGNDWTAVGGKFSGNASQSANLTTASGLIYVHAAGAIGVDAGANIILDLNGHKINRGLTKDTAKGGQCIYITGNLTIRDTSSGKNGQITGNFSTGAHGAVQLGGGSLKFESGYITGNRSTGGAGIRLSGGKFTMTGGTVSNNISYGDPTFTDYGGSCGGGMYSSMPITITGGTFSGNESAHGSAIDIRDYHCVNGAASSVSGVTFSNNNQTGNGVIHCWDRFTISNCTFTGNTGKSGGIYTRYDPNSAQQGWYLKAINCTFSNNTATTGAALFIDGYGNAELDGCTITGNKSNGGAVFVQGNSKLSLKGAVNISGNTKASNTDAANIVNSSAANPIFISGALTGSGKIGLYSRGQTTSGWQTYMGTAHPNTKFTSDVSSNAIDKITVNGKTECLVKEAASTKTLVAIPSATSPATFDNAQKIIITGYDSAYMTPTLPATGVSVSGTNIVATRAGKYAVKFTLKNTSTTAWADGTTTEKSITGEIRQNVLTFTSVPDKKVTYNGSAQSITATTNISVGVSISYAYKKGDTALTGAPTDAGTYTVTATAKVNDSYKNDYYNNSISESATLTINKSDLNITAFSYTAITYGTVSDAPSKTIQRASTNTTLTSGYGTITYSVASGTGAAKIDSGTGKITPTKAGTVKVTMKIDASTNYNEASKTIEVTIGKKAVTYSGFGSTTSFVYNGAAQKPTAATTQAGVTGETLNFTVGAGETNVGSHTLTVTFASVTGGQANKDNYTVTGLTKGYSITELDLTNNTTVSGQSAVTYNGKAQTFTLSVTNTGMSTTGKTVAAADYTVTYDKNIDAGTASIKIAGKNNCKGSKTVTFTINPKEITYSGFGSTTSFVYNGTAQKPTAATTQGGVTGETLNFTVGAGETNVGSHTLTVTFASVTGGQKNTNNYKVTGLTKGYSITVLDLTNDTTVSGQSTVTYNGKAQTFTLSVTNTGMSTTGKVVAAADYTVTYDKNTDAGTASIKISGKNNCTGSTTVNFTINPLDISSGTTVSGVADRTYSGAAQTFTGLSITNGNLATADKTVPTGGYSVSYAHNTDAALSTAANAPSVVFTGTGNYTGSFTQKFTIKPLYIAVDWDTAALVYTGSWQMPTAKLTVGGTAVTPVWVKGDKKYTYSYSSGDIAFDITLSVDADGGIKAGTHTNRAAVGSKNFTLSSSSDTQAITATYTIAQKTLIVSWSGASFEYDTAEHLPVLQVKGTGSSFITVADWVAADEKRTRADFTLDNVACALAIKLSGDLNANKKAIESGDYTATLEYDSENFLLQGDASFDYVITDHELTLSWDTNADTSHAFDNGYWAPTLVVQGESRNLFDLSQKTPDAQNEISIDLSYRSVTATLVVWFEDGKGNKVKPVNTGSYVLKAKIEGSFSISNDTNAYSITKQSVAVVWDSSTLSLVYTSEALKPAYTVKDEQGNTVAVSLTFAAEADSALTGTEAVNVGDYTLTVASADANDNYTLTDASKGFSITPATATVVWTGATRTYDGKLVLPVAKYSRLDGGENTCTVTLDGDGIDAGSYTATAATDDKNYTLDASKTTTFKVDPLDITIGWSTAALTFDDGAKMPDATVSYGSNSATVDSWTVDSAAGNRLKGVATFDDFTVTLLVIVAPDGSHELVAYRAVNAGNYDITAVETALNDGGTNNFNITGTATGSFTVGKRNVRLVWADVSVAYDGTAKTPSVKVYDNATNKEVTTATVTVSFTSGALTDGKAVDRGNYGVKADLGDNYAIVSNETSTLSINALQVTASLGDASVSYNGSWRLPEIKVTPAGGTAKTVSESDWTVADNGVKNVLKTTVAFDNYSISLTLEIGAASGSSLDDAGLASAVGSYLVTALTADGNNFNITGTDSLGFDIGAADVSVSWNAKAGYTGAATAPSATVTLGESTATISSWTVSSYNGASALKGEAKFSDKLICDVYLTFTAKTGSALKNDFAVDVGEYSLTAAVGGNFSLTGGDTADFSIDASAVTLDWAADGEFVYDGTAKQPAVSYDGTEISWTKGSGNVYTATVSVAGVDCNLTLTLTKKGDGTALENAVDVGEYTVSVSAENFTLTNSSKDFEIKPMYAEIAWDEDSLNLTYNGIAQYPSFTVTLGGTAATVASGDWTAADGKLTATVTAGSASLVLTLETDGGATNVGTYAATLSAGSNFSFDKNSAVVTTAKQYKISPLPVAVTWDETEFTYDNTAKYPAITAEIGEVSQKITSWTAADGKLTSTVTVDDNVSLVIELALTGASLTDGSAINAGNYTATLSVGANFTFTAGSAVNTLSEAVTVKPRYVELSLEKDELVYNGAAQTPVVKAPTGVEGLTVAFTTQTGVKNGNAWVKRDATDVGSYLVRIITEDTNFTFSDSAVTRSQDIAFSVTQLDVGVNWTQADDEGGITLLYTGSSIVPEAELVIGGTAYAVSWIDASGVISGTVTAGSVVCTVTLAIDAVSGELSDNRAVEEGQYSATLSFGANFRLAEGSSDAQLFTVKKAVVDTIVFEVESKDYDGTLPEVEAKEMPEGVSASYRYYKYDENAENHLGEEVQANEAVNVGSYVVVATFAAPATFAEIPDKYAEFTIRALEIDISGLSFTGNEVTYNGKEHAVSLTGTAAGIKSYTFVYEKDGNTVPANEVRNAGTYNVTVTFVAEDNYVFKNGENEKTTTLEIAQVDLYISANANTITYGDAPSDNGVSARGFVNKESFGDLGGEIAYAYSYVAGAAVGSNYTITPSGYTSGNYNIHYEIGVLTVKPLTVEVEWSESDEPNAKKGTHFTYTEDGFEHKPCAVVTNVKFGDSVILTVTGGQSAAGFGYTAEVTGVSNGNYVLAADGEKATFDIVPQPKTGRIIWDSTTLYYNGKSQLPKAYYYANESDEEPTALRVIMVGSTVPNKAGTYKARVDTSLDLTGDREITYVIEKRPVYIVVPDLTVKAGDEIDLTQLNWSYLSDDGFKFVDNENYTISFSTTAQSGAVAGTFPISATFTCNNAANYDVIFTGSWSSAGADNGKCGTLTVESADSGDLPNLTFIGAQVTYDGKVHVITVVGLPAGVVASFAYSENGFAVGTDGVVNAGEYKVKITFTNGEGEEVYDGIELDMTVKKASLTVKANDSAIEYGDAARPDGYTATGFVTDTDTAATALKGAAVYAYGYNVGDPVGSYRISVSGLTAENYEITFVDGSLNVGKRTLVVNWLDKENGSSSTHFSYNYDGTTVYAPFATVSNLYGSDTVEVTVTGATGAAGLNYVATATVESDKYKMPTDGSESVTFDVIPPALTIVWDNSPLYYNGANQKPQAYYFENGELKALTVTVSGDCKDAKIKYTATVTDPDGVTLSGEHSYEYEILPKAVTVTINDLTVIYTGTNAGQDFAFTCDRPDISGITLTSVAKQDASVGVYAITGAYSGTNYEITFVEGTLTVNKATYVLNPQITDTATYDGTAKHISVTGLPEGVTYSVTYVLGGVNLGENGAVAAGTYKAVISYKGDGVNYEAIPDAEVNFTVERAQLKLDGITFADGSATYDGKAHTLTVSGSAAGVTGVAYTYYDDKDAPLTANDIVNAGTYKIVATFTADSNYDIADNTLTAYLTIDPATLTVTADDISVTYGDELGENAFGYTVSGFVNGENDGVLSGEVSFTCDYTAGTGVGNSLKIGFNEAACTIAAPNYEIVYSEGTLTVTPRTVEVAWAGGDNFVFVYDGNEHAPEATVSNAFGGDTVGLEVSGAQSAIGENYLATVTGITGGNGNYVLAPEAATHTFSILKNPDTGVIVWNNAPLYYNGESQAPTAYYNDADGKRHDLEVTVDEGSAVNVGSYTARVSVDGLNLEGDAYKVFSIEKRTVYVVIPDAEAAYGETPNMAALVYSYPDGCAEENKFIESGVTLTFSHDEVTGVGKYKISCKLASHTQNYNVVFTGSWVSADADNGRYGTLTVTQAEFDISDVRFGVSEFTYDGGVHALTVYGVPAGVSYKLGYSKDGFDYGTAGVKDAGVYDVTITFTTDDGNFKALPPMNTKLTIKKAALTVKARDNAITYGDEPNANGVEITGFVGGENIDVLLGGDTYSFNYARLGNVGSYAITPSGFVSGNYEITYVAGTLTVAPLKVTVAWYSDDTLGSGVLNYAEDGTEHLPYAVVTNAIGGEKVTLTVSGGQSAAGVGYVATVTGISNSNYAIPSGDAAKTLFNVLSTTETYAVIWAETPLYYNGEDQAPKAYYIDSEGALIELTVTVAGEHKNAGATYTATVTDPDGVTLTGDKSKSYVIGKQSLTVELGAYTAVYNETVNPVYSGEYSYLGITLTTDAVKGSAVGEYEVRATYTDANYDVTFVNGTLTIIKATYSFTPVITDTAVYDGNPARLTVSGLPEGVSYSVTYYKDGVNYGTAGVVDVGAYQTVITYTGDGNYEAIPSGTHVFTVTKAPANLGGITFEDGTAQYNGKAHGLFVSGSATGVTAVTYTYYRNSVSDANLIDASEVVGAGTYIVVASFTVDGNYYLTDAVKTKQATLTVEKATLTVQANDMTLTYGTTVATDGYGYVISGLAAGDTVTSINLTGSAYLTVETAEKYVVGSYGITFDESASTLSAANYKVKYVGATLTVTPVVIEVSWTDENGFKYVYDGNEHLPEATVTNAVYGDVVELEISGAQSAVGTGYLATVTGVAGGNPNYVLPVQSITQTFDILKNPDMGVIVWDNSPLYYNGENRIPAAYFVDDNGNKVQLIVTVNGDSKQAGHTYRAYAEVDASLGIEGDTYIDFEVLPLPVYVVIDDVRKTYGESLTGSDYGWHYLDEDGNKFLDGNFNITFAVEASDGAVGKYKISAEYSSVNAGNYDVKFTGSWISADGDNGRYGTLTIAKATLDTSSLTVTDTEASYDGKKHVVKVNGLPEGVTADISYTLNGWSYGGDGVTEVGEYAVLVSFVYDTEKYNPVADITATLTIRKASLVIKANPYTITYGDAPAYDAENPVTVTGFVAGEEESGLEGLGGSLTFTFNYAQYGNAGSYLIIPGGLTSDKYDITFLSGVLTVERRTLTVEWYSDKTMSSTNLQYNYVSDSTRFVPYAVAGNLVNGDKVTLTVTGAQSKAGLGYTAEISAVSNANYALPADGTATAKFDVIPRSNVVVWDNSPIYYDGAEHRPAAYYFDENGVKVDLTSRVRVTVGGMSVTGVSAVGSYLAEITGDTTGLTGNLSMSFSISKRVIKVVIDSVSAPYGNVPASYGWHYAEGSDEFLSPADEALVTIRCSASNASNAGNYVITGVCASDNYEVTFVNGTLTITKADYDLNVTFADKTVVYDGEVHGIELTGTLPEGVTYTVTYVKDGVRYGADEVREAGVYTATVTFAGDTVNHNAILPISAELEITARTLDLSGISFEDNDGVVYDGKAHTIYVSGDMTGIGGVTFEYFDSSDNRIDAGKLVNAGTYTIVATFTAADNYRLDVNTKSAKLTIVPATLTVTANDKTLAYGDAVDSNGYGYVISGFVNGENDGVVSGTVGIKVQSSENYAVGAYALVPDKENGTLAASNYNFEYVDGTLTVTRRVIGAEWYDAENGTQGTDFEYVNDGSAHIPYAKATGTVNGDIITLTVKTEQSATGFGYVAVVVGISGDNAASYELPVDGLRCAFSIKDATVQTGKIIWDYAPLYYNGTAQAPKAYYYADGDENGNPVEITDITVDGEAVEAGTYTATATLGGTTSETEFRIERRKVYVSINDVTVRYGETVRLRWTYLYGDTETHFLTGDDKGVTLTADGLTEVGEYAISGAYSHENEANYEVIFTGNRATADADNGKCGTLVIEKASYAASDVVFGETEAAYDGNAHRFEISVPEGVTAHVTYSLNGWSYGEEGVINAGEYKVEVSFTVDANHNEIPSFTTTFTVKKAELIITANDASVYYGDEIISNGVSYSVEGVEGTLGGTLTYAYGCKQYDKVGKYTVTPGGLTSSNFDVVFVSGVLEIKPRPVSVIWLEKEGGSQSDRIQYVSDGTPHMPYAVAAGLVEGQSVKLTVTGSYVSAGMNYVAKVTAVNDPNYTLPVDGTGSVTFDILPASYEIVWEQTEFVYNGREQAPQAYYYTDKGEQVELDVTVTGYHADAGTYTAQASIRGGAVTVTGEFERKYTISRLPVTVVIDDVTATYGSEVKSGGWHYGGDAQFIGGSPVLLTVNATASSDVGEYAITGKCTNNNYAVTFINGRYVVEKAIISAPSLSDVEYTGARIKAEIEGCDLYSVVSNQGGTPVGEYDVVLELTDSRNYAWDGSASSVVVLKYNIVKAENVWTEEYEIEGWTVVAEEDFIRDNQPVSKFGTPQVRYYKDENCYVEVTRQFIETTTTTNTYYVKVTVEGTENYTSLEFVHSFRVSGKRAVTLHWTEKVLVYNGEYQAPKAYVVVGGDVVWLTVEGLEKNAGTYSATATLIGIDGVDYSALYDIYDGEDAESLTVEYVIKTVEITVALGDLHAVYGGDLPDVSEVTYNYDASLVVAGDSLGLSFTCELAGKAGAYAIVGSWTNTNYSVTFTGSWTEEGELAGKAGTYTVDKAQITVSGTGTEWFADDTVTDKYQSSFVTLGEKNADGSYKFVSFAGGAETEVEITYADTADRYDEDTHKNMTQSQLMQMFENGGKTTAPEISDAGVWVVYYRISIANHEDLYGIWTVSILGSEEFVVITFVKPYEVAYGDTVSGKNLIDALIDGGYITVDGAITDIEELRNVASAYAYSGKDGFVADDAGKGGYFIEFSVKKGINRDLKFKYGPTNDNDSTNVDSYEIVERELSVEWGETSFEYDGASHLPTAKLTGLLGGQTVDLELAIGESKSVTLANGDVITFTARLEGDATAVGEHKIIIEIAEGNYVLAADSCSAVIKIAEPKTPVTPDDPVPGKEGGLPAWAIGAICAGGAAVAVAVVMLIVKRRKPAAGSGDADGFDDIVEE